MSSTDLGSFKAQAYENPDGVAIRTNPETGYKELFIAGSRDFKDWTSNIHEGQYHLFEKFKGLLELKGGKDKAQLVKEAEGLGKLEAMDPIGMIGMDRFEGFLGLSESHRDEFSAYIDRIIEAEGVDVVYGHSRGAAIASGLKSDVKIIGLDGATFIGHDDSHMLNINQPASEGYAFDFVLDAGHKNSITLKDRAFHDVTRAYGSDKPEAPKATKASIARDKKRKNKLKKTRLPRLAKFFDKITGTHQDQDEKSKTLKKFEDAIKEKKRKQKIMQLRKKRERDRLKMELDFDEISL